MCERSGRGPFNPATWLTDGRMYPVQDDNKTTVLDKAGKDGRKVFWKSREFQKKS